MYHFKPIADISGTANNEIIDVLAVVVRIGESAEITTKQGRAILKCDLSLTDRSDALINITLWDQHVHNTLKDISIGSVIAFKSVRVTDYSMYYI